MLGARDTHGAGLSFTGAKPSWTLYVVVGMFALLKDILDIVFGFMPGLGTVLSFAFGLCFSTIIFLLLTVFDRSGAGSSKNRVVAKQFVQRLTTLLGVTLADALPFANFLPMTTLSIMFLYWMARQNWKKSIKTS